VHFYRVKDLPRKTETRNMQHGGSFWEGHSSCPILFNIWGPGHPGYAGGNSSLMQEKTKLSLEVNQSRKAC